MPGRSSTTEKGSCFGVWAELRIAAEGTVRGRRVPVKLELNSRRSGIDNPKPQNMTPFRPPPPSRNPPPPLASPRDPLRQRSPSPLRPPHATDTIRIRVRFTAGRPSIRACSTRVLCRAAPTQNFQGSALFSCERLMASAYNPDCNRSVARLLLLQSCHRLCRRIRDAIDGQRRNVVTESVQTILPEDSSSLLV